MRIFGPCGIGSPKRHKRYLCCPVFCFAHNALHSPGGTIIVTTKIMNTGSSAMHKKFDGRNEFPLLDGC